MFLFLAGFFEVAEDELRKYFAFKWLWSLRLAIFYLSIHYFILKKSCNGILEDRNSWKWLRRKRKFIIQAHELDQNEPARWLDLHRSAVQEEKPFFFLILSCRDWLFCLQNEFTSLSLGRKLFEAYRWSWPWNGVKYEFSCCRGAKFWSALWTNFVFILYFIRTGHFTGLRVIIS